MLRQSFVTIELHAALATQPSAVNRRLMIVQVALLRVGARAVAALKPPNQMSLKVISEKNELLCIVVANNARKHHRLLLVGLFVVQFKGHSIIEHGCRLAVNAQYFN